MAIPATSSWRYVIRPPESDEVRFDREFLTDRQRPRLKVARDYAGELEVRLWHWWNQAAVEIGGDEAVEQEQNVKRDLLPKLRRLSASKPLRVDKRDDWEQDIREALSFMRARGVSVKFAKELFRKDLRTRFKSADARRKHRRQFNRAVRGLEE